MGDSQYMRQFNPFKHMNYGTVKASLKAAMDSIVWYVTRRSPVTLYSVVRQDEWWMGNNLEGSGRGLIQDISQNFPAKAKGNDGNSC
jgi:hypothetical protein